MLHLQRSARWIEVVFVVERQSELNLPSVRRTAFGGIDCGRVSGRLSGHLINELRSRHARRQLTTNCLLSIRSPFVITASRYPRVPSNQVNLSDFFCITSASVLSAYYYYYFHMFSHISHMCTFTDSLCSRSFAYIFLLVWLLPICNFDFFMPFDPQKWFFRLRRAKHLFEVYIYNAR